MKTPRSRRLFERARSLIPGGVNSPVRAFGPVGGLPRFIARGKGARIFDVDGNEYVDYVVSWGPLILGHAHPGVLRAVRAALKDGTWFGAPTELETLLAHKICDALPSVESVRLVSSGTEATMSALRLARGVTGRPRILKFDGCYHGHSDSLLVGAGSGVATLGIPGSPGVPAAFTELTVRRRTTISRRCTTPSRVGATRSPASSSSRSPATWACVLPEPGFLEGLRETLRRVGALLILDEVMTGFRVAWGGAQGLYGIEPDLTCLGKVIGGGLPAAAYGGRRELMDRLAPDGPVYQAGTLSGNPLAMAAGLETLRRLDAPGIYERLSAVSAQLAAGLREAAEFEGVELHTASVGGMFGFFFHPGPVRNFAEARKADAERFRLFFAAMLESGVYLPPSPFEACFVSLAHRPADVEKTLVAARAALRRVARAR